MIDHAWAVALNRAQKAGILLAHILMSGGHGERPVTLIGYSMGARLIFHCLLELCRHSAKGACLTAERILRENQMSAAYSLQATNPEPVA